MPTEDGANALEGCFLFRDLDEEERRQLISHAHRQRFAAGSVIFHMGSEGQSMMAVLSGSVRLSIPSPQGKEIVLAHLASGEVFGEIALLDGNARSADARALTNCELLVLDRRVVLPFLEQHPRACLKLLSTLCRRLRHVDEQMADILFLELPVRLAKVLLRQPPSPKLGLSQRELGNQVGGRRESVNRCLQQWQRRGIVRLSEGWIVILDPRELARIAEGK